MKHILVGVTGSIAAYKSAELVRLLKKSGYEVRVVMTQSATQFITPMTLQVLSQNEVRTDLFSQEKENKISHIELARWADTILIAPITANFIAKLAAGIADDLLSTICLASAATTAVAPAMNQQMLKHPATQQNLDTLRCRGVKIIAPAAGEQACGEVGVGRMAEPVDMVSWLDEQQVLMLENKLPKVLSGKHLLITAGPTRERIDPVRYISNDSSGKMGYALAEAAQQLGAEVILVSGKTALEKPLGVTVINVESAKQMFEQVMEKVQQSDWFIAAAAVSDYAAAEISPQKIKKTADAGLNLTLVQNPDILKLVCQLPHKPLCIGFAAETEKVIEHAKAKRLKKGADFIIANDVSDSSIGFYSDNNAAVMIGEQTEIAFAKTSKRQLAKQLLLKLLETDKKSVKPLPR